MLAEAPISQQHMEDLLLAHRLQEEEDQNLARKLQGEEIHQVGLVRNQKGFTAFESEVYRLKFKSTADSDEESEGETEYDYTEPQRGQTIEWPILYDKYQKQEDKEIGHVSKRHPCKRINAAPTALHHRSVDQRGKVVKDKPVYNKPGPVQRAPTVPKQIAPTELTDYGFVLRTPGPAQFLVYIWSSGQTLLCKPQGKLKNLNQYKNKNHKGVTLRWPSKSCMVMLQYRYYQKNKAEIVTALSEKEEADLRINTLHSHLFQPQDMCLQLPTDLITKVKAYLFAEDIVAASRVSTAWFEVLK